MRAVDACMSYKDDMRDTGCVTWLAPSGMPHDRRWREATTDTLAAPLRTLWDFGTLRVPEGVTPAHLPVRAGAGAGAASLSLPLADVPEGTGLHPQPIVG